MGGYLFACKKEDFTEHWIASRLALFGFADKARSGTSFCKLAALANKS
ncbi:MAG TPA: hypothetical protein VIJ72_02075 [Rhizomicrobium sp.]